MVWQFHQGSTSYADTTKQTVGKKRKITIIDVIIKNQIQIFGPK